MPISADEAGDPFHNLPHPFDGDPAGQAEKDLARRHAFISYEKIEALLEPLQVENLDWSHHSGRYLYFTVYGDDREATLVRVIKREPDSTLAHLTASDTSAGLIPSFPILARIVARSASIGFVSLAISLGKVN